MLQLKMDKGFHEIENINQKGARNEKKKDKTIYGG